MPRSLSQDSRGSYDSDKYSNYTDSFDSDDGRSTRNTKNENSNRQKAIRKTYGSKARKPPSSQTPRSDYVTSRMKSARRNKANEYRNQIAQLQSQIDEFKLEQKILRKQGRLQERALQKFEDSESELPALLQRHAAEVKNLRDQIKKQRDKNQDLARKLKDNDLEIDKLKRQLKKYKRLVEEKHLDEREALQQKYERAEQRAEDAEQRVQEKEKELDIKNIYSQRIIRAPHKLPSTASSFGSGHNASNLSRKPNTTGSDPGPTPRERMLGYDKRLRDEQKVKKQPNEDESTFVPKERIEIARKEREHLLNDNKSKDDEEKLFMKEFNGQIVFRSLRVNESPTHNLLIENHLNKESEEEKQVDTFRNINNKGYKTEEERKSNEINNKQIEENYLIIHHDIDHELDKTENNFNKDKNIDKELIGILENEVNRIEKEQDKGERIYRCDNKQSNLSRIQSTTQFKRRPEEKKVVSFLTTTPVRVKKIARNRPTIEKSMTAKRQTDVYCQGRLNIIDEVPELYEENNSLIVSLPFKSNEVRNEKVIEKNSKSYSQLLQLYDTKAAGFPLTPGSDESSIMCQELERERKAEEKRRQRAEWENQERTRREEEERYHKQLEERRRLEDEEEDRRAEERRRREEEERKKRELEEAGYREKLEKEKLEREERERKQREEEERLKEIEKQRKAKEEEERQRREDEERAKEAAAVREKKHQLDLLKKKLADIDAQKEKDEPVEDPIFSPGRHRKDYTFTKVVENMHNGLPSHEPEVLPKRLSRDRLFSDDDIGYNPSAPSAQKTVKKNLLTDLFGDSKMGNDDKSNDIFNPKPPTKVVSGRRSGGSGKLNRPRQQAQTITSKPAIKAVDDIDDDIEELVL
ncbi:DgyrCDS4864 [Dimorphilus gyrociliatus]|uniref:DgyrCDS4864 n=1 Tax=Dimorphilus gyrociliatus TaxID=2664684 RepID=A0A7I8VIA8_9ANNE|nr:DgyrCDS4864 [Dimorphilus gyrociliatus]